MNTAQTLIFFNSIGIAPNFKGYQYLIYVVGLAVCYHDRPFPTLKFLYAQTARHFRVSDSIISDDIRTLLHVYWDRYNTDLFSRITHYPVRGQLTSKEFICIVSEYLSSQS